MGGFNAEEHEELRDNTPLPEGEYYLELEEAKVKETQNKQGTGLNATFNVLGDESNPFRGRKVFNWFNLQHTNETAQKIGQAEFAALCKAVEVIAPQDTGELIGKPFLAKVGIDKKDQTKNVIKKYSPIDGAPAKPATQAATPAPAQPAASGATKKMPWQ